MVGDDLTLRDYASRPYARYDDSETVPGSTFEDDRLHPKALVVGVTGGDGTKAYPLSAVAGEDVVNDVVGGRPVLVATAPGRRLVAYDRTVDGTTLRFEAAGERFLRADDSRWKRTTGSAVTGPHRGTGLDRANESPPLFWFSWLDFNPDTALFAADG